MPIAFRVSLMVKSSRVARGPGKKCLEMSDNAAKMRRDSPRQW